MSTRLEKKLKTRHNLMFGALGLVEDGQHFSTISIREVAKSAQVVPTSFYRHFADMDDLGLALVDELSLVLRQLMRRARQEVITPDMIIQNSVNLFIEHVYANTSFYIFMSQELTGGSKKLRDAIRSELLYFANELAADLRKLHMMDHLSVEVVDQLCLHTIMTVAMNTTELLDVREDHKEVERLRERMVMQLRMVFLGAANWVVDKPSLNKSENARG